MAARRGRGQPTKYDPKRMLTVVRAMAKLGATDVEIAQALKVGLSTVELWARTHLPFLRALKPPKAAADDRVERSLFKRATGYTYDSEEIFTYNHTETRKDAEGVEVTTTEKRVLRVPTLKHVPPDPTSGIFWMKNRRSKEWRNFKAFELSTPPGRPIEILEAPGEPDLIGAYHERLRRAAARSAPARADPGAHPNVDRGGQGPEGPPGDPKAHQS